MKTAGWLGALVVVVGACSSDGEAVTTTTMPTAAASATVAPVTTDDLTIVGGTATEGDLRTTSVDGLEAEGTIVVPIDDGDMSFLAWAVSESAGDEVIVTSIVDPGGDEVYGLDFETFETSGPAFTDVPLVGTGEVAVFYPPGPDTAIVAGDYLVSFETDGAFIEAAGAIMRSGDPDAPQILDVRFWMATTVPELSDAGTLTELETRLRDVGDEVLTPHVMSVGDLDFIAAPTAIVERFADLRLGQDDGPQRDLCAEMDVALPPGRALNVVMVDRISATDDEGGVIEGNAAGLPGVVLVPGATTSCVVMMAAPDDFEARDVFDRAVTAWHEAAHLMGLPHTTELEGTAFDFFADTPECDANEFDRDGDGVVDAIDCPDGDNFMFHDSDGTTLTTDQAWMLRRHPLFRPSR